MSKKNVKKGKTVKPRKGKLGDIFGFPVTAVLRKLGSCGVSIPHARAIVKAKKIKMPDNSVGVQIGYGRHKSRPLAPLSNAQVMELKATAADPSKNGESKKPKAKKAKPQTKVAPESVAV